MCLVSDAKGPHVFICLVLRDFSHLNSNYWAMGPDSADSACIRPFRGRGRAKFGFGITVSRALPTFYVFPPPTVSSLF